MVLHMTMIALLTSLLGALSIYYSSLYTPNSPFLSLLFSVIMNEHFALYARAMGRNWVYLFYPEDYTGYRLSYNNQ